MVMDPKPRTLNEALQQASFFLSQANWDPELAKNYWMHLFDWTLTDLVKQLNQPVSSDALELYQQALERIINHEPIQYISGHAYFNDHKYWVTPACLIPREETLGLVELAIAYIQKHPVQRVLEIGTGSGVIAIEIKKAFPYLEVYASDLSKQALYLAARNAEEHQVDISWIHSDVFDQIPSNLSFDLLISNPPYISEDEQELMDESVRRFEPELALYAEDHGLAVYKKILAGMAGFLNKSAAAFFEIGFQQGAELKKQFSQMGPHTSVSIQQDYLGKDRYLIWRRETGKNENATL